MLNQYSTFKHDLRKTYSTDTRKLLEHHQGGTDDSSPDKLRFEHVDPRSNLEFEFGHKVLALKRRMALDNNLSVLDGLRPDADPLGLKSRVGGRISSKTHESVEGIFVATCLSKPSR